MRDRGFGFKVAAGSFPITSSEKYFLNGSELFSHFSTVDESYLEINSCRTFSDLRHDF